MDSTGALELAEIPAELLVIGGGYVGLELGTVYAALGSHVTLVEMTDALLPGVDRDLVQPLARRIDKLFTAVHLRSRVAAVRATAGRVDVEIEGHGARSFDRVLVAVGRRPFTADLGLEGAGVALDARGRITVDHRFETSVPGVHAIGDVIAGPMLAHKAEDEGIACVELLAGRAGHVNYDAIPSVVYTWPELAGVGKTEEECRDAGRAVRIGRFPFMANGRARAAEERDGLVKIIADPGTDRVLGVHVLGPRASDLIAEAVLAMEFGGSAEDIARTCHPHPTFSEAVREAALDVDGRSIHQ
jgi:dihydrolipoamide dehydrogenase